MKNMDNFLFNHYSYDTVLDNRFKFIFSGKTAYEVFSSIWNTSLTPLSTVDLIPNSNRNIDAFVDREYVQDVLDSARIQKEKHFSKINSLTRSVLNLDRQDKYSTYELVSKLEDETFIKRVQQQFLGKREDQFNGYTKIELVQFCIDQIVEDKVKIYIDEAQLENDVNLIVSNEEESDNEKDVLSKFFSIAKKHGSQYTWGVDSIDKMLRGTTLTSNGTLKFINSYFYFNPEDRNGTPFFPQNGIFKLFHDKKAALAIRNKVNLKTAKDISSYNSSEVSKKLNSDVGRISKKSYTSNPLVSQQNFYRVFDSIPDLDLKSTDKSVKFSDLKDLNLEDSLDFIFDLKKFSKDAIDGLLNDFSFSELKSILPKIESKLEDVDPNNVGQIQNLERLKDVIEFYNSIDMENPLDSDKIKSRALKYEPSLDNLDGDKTLLNKVYSSILEKPKYTKKELDLNSPVEPEEKEKVNDIMKKVSNDVEIEDYEDYEKQLLIDLKYQHDDGTDDVEPFSDVIQNNYYKVPSSSIKYAKNRFNPEDNIYELFNLIDNLQDGLDTPTQEYSQSSYIDDKTGERKEGESGEVDSTLEVLEKSRGIQELVNVYGFDENCNYFVALDQISAANGNKVFGKAIDKVFKPKEIKKSNNFSLSGYEEILDRIVNSIRREKASAASTAYFQLRDKLIKKYQDLNGVTDLSRTELKTIDNMIMNHAVNIGNKAIKIKDLINNHPKIKTDFREMGIDNE